MMQSRDTHSGTRVVTKYLTNHAEPGLATPPTGLYWDNVLCVPIYDEPPDCLEKLACFYDTLVILVVNHPDGSSTDLNKAFVDGLLNHHAHVDLASHCHLITLCASNNRHALLIDASAGKAGFNPDQGVGLARKIAADTALLWWNKGVIQSNWIAQTDADALLPSDFFDALNELHESKVGAVHAFEHQTGDSPEHTFAMDLYEAKLHQYVSGLIESGSPYVSHAIGSCISIRPEAYAGIRGIPKRAAGEDFYCLNKLHKLGGIATFQGDSPVMLDARISTRTPFGTGQSVRAILNAPDPAEHRLFYPPEAFKALESLLGNVRDGRQTLETVLDGLPQCSAEWLIGRGLEKALTHCRTHGRTPDQFQYHFHIWFDAFMTLKFLHSIAPPNEGLISLKALSKTLRLQPRSANQIKVLYRDRCYKHLIDNWEGW